MNIVISTFLLLPDPLAAMGQDIPTLVGRCRERIAFIHMRDLKGHATQFTKFFAKKASPACALYSVSTARSGWMSRCGPTTPPDIEEDRVHNSAVIRTNVGYIWLRAVYRLADCPPTVERLK